MNSVLSISLNSLYMWNPRFLVTLFCLVVSSFPLTYSGTDMMLSGLGWWRMHCTEREKALILIPLSKVAWGKLFHLCEFQYLPLYYEVTIAMSTSLRCWEAPMRGWVWKCFEMVMLLQRQNGGLSTRNALRFRSVEITMLWYPRYTLGSPSIFWDAESTGFCTRSTESSSWHRPVKLG